MRNHRDHSAIRNCWHKLVQGIKTQVNGKNGEKWRLFTKKTGLKNYIWWVFWHVWARFFMPVNFPPTLSMNCIFSGQKSLNDFSPHFGHFFTARPISESYNNPLKVIPEGSMVEYLSVGSQEAPQTITGKKKFPDLQILNHNPSPLCILKPL